MLFYPLAALIVGTSLGVVATRNPVRSALALVSTLFLLAICYIMLQAHLVAALQIIVYAGAVMVLFLFVITLLNLQADPNDKADPLLSGLALVSALGIAGGLGAALLQSEAAQTTGALPEGFGTTVVLARTMFADHIVAFELTSVMLLVAVVGAVVLAKLDRPAVFEEEAAEPASPALAATSAASHDSHGSAGSHGGAH